MAKDFVQSYRLDRNYFRIQSYEQSAHTRAYWLTKSPQERIEAAWYLICCAYNLNRNEPQRLDRQVFSIRKQII